MDYKGLVSFGIGGTIVMMAFWNLTAHVQDLQFGYNTNFLISLILQNGALSFIGFLLIGIGLKLIFKSEKAESCL